MVCYHATTSLSRHWFKCPSKLSTPLFCLTMLLSNHSPEHRLKALVYAQVDSLMGQKGKQLPNKIKDTLRQARLALSTNRGNAHLFAFTTLPPAWQSMYR